MDIVAFNWVDGLFLGLIIFSTLISFVRGFVREAISLATWIAAFWVAHEYGHEFGVRFLTMIEMGQMRSLIASAILFFAVLLVGAFINYSINSFLNGTGLSPIDRVLGMAFGFARGILLVAVLILLGELTQMNKKPWWPESQLIPEFSSVSEWLKSFVPEQFERLKQMEEGKKQSGNVKIPLETPSPTASSQPATPGQAASPAPTKPDATTISEPAPSSTQPLLPPDKKQSALPPEPNNTKEPVGNAVYY